MAIVELSPKSSALDANDGIGGASAEVTSIRLSNRWIVLFTIVTVLTVHAGILAWQASGHSAFLLLFVEGAPFFNQINPLTNALADAAHARPGLEDVIPPLFRCSSEIESARLAPSQVGRSS